MVKRVLYEVSNNNIHNDNNSSNDNDNRNVCVKKALEVSNITTAHQNHLVVLGDIDEIPSSSGLNVLKWYDYHHHHPPPPDHNHHYHYRCNIKSSDDDTYFGYRPQMMSFITNRYTTIATTHDRYYCYYYY